MKDKPVDRDVDRMRELLARTPPRDPGTAGRSLAGVDRARRDRIRKRRGVIGGVAVAALAAAVIVTPHFLSTSPTTNEATDPSNGVHESSEGPDPSTTDPCPVMPIDVSDAGSVPALPTGAESVRLCPAVVPKQDLASSWTAPPDAVVKSPDSFVDAVNAAPAWDPAECAAVDWVGDPFAIVVTYPEETLVIGARAPLCTAVKIGNKVIGSDEVIAAYVAAIRTN